jgi:hypothetical protein
MSRDVTWCIRCGSYAESAAKGLTKRCRGRFNGVGGLVGQLKALMAGRHPATGATLPPPILEAKWSGHGSTGAVSEALGASWSPSLGAPGGETETARGGARFVALRERVRAKEVATRTSEPLGGLTEATHQVARRRVTGKRKICVDSAPGEPQGAQGDPAANGSVLTSKRRRSLGMSGC